MTLAFTTLFLPARTRLPAGNRNEVKLMDCLQDSGETNWWKDFANCTSAEQCIDLAYEKNFK